MTDIVRQYVSYLNQMAAETDMDEIRTIASIICQSARVAIMGSNRTGFSASQLDQVQRAVELQMPEDMILHFATPDRTPLQMARYIDFYQIQGNDLKTESRQNLFSRIKKYLRRKDEQDE